MTTALSRLFKRTSWEQRKRFLRSEAWIFVVICYLLIAAAYVWPEDFRSSNTVFVGVSWVLFMVRTFIFHVGLLLLVIGVVSARARNRGLAMATAPLLAVCLGPMLRSYLPGSAAPAAGPTLTVMSVNLLAGARETEHIIAEIKAADPDVLLLQEYTDDWHEALEAALGPDYPLREHVVRDDSFGIAVYSRLPVVEPVERRLPLGGQSVPQMRAVVEHAGRKVAVYHIHLRPPELLEYTVATRLQFADLSDRVADESLPVIVAGDFNFTPRSAQAAALRRLGLAEAQQAAGRGRGATWPVISFYRYLPGLRLDQVYVSEELTCIEARTGGGSGSDHRPVVAKVAFRGVGR